MAHSNFLINLLEMCSLGMTEEESLQLSDSAAASSLTAVGIYVS